MTTSDRGALQAMLADHAALSDGVGRRMAALVASVTDGGGFEAASAALVAYLAAEILPHASAEEATVYRLAAARPELAEAARALAAEYGDLAFLVDRLATATDADAAVAGAGAIEELVADHVAEENRHILQPLGADETVDLEGVREEMRRLIEQAGTVAASRQDEETPDTEAALVRLLLEAAGDLAGARMGDRACHLAAATWAAIRAPRPDLAVRVTAALHRLVRSVDPEPVRISRGARAGGNGDAVLDVRALAPATRHETIFAAYGALGPGTAFVLVNDHDPKPLRYQFEAEHSGEHTWNVLEAGPTQWRVRIGRLAPIGEAGDGAHGYPAPTDAARGANEPDRSRSALPR